jgi:predicted RNA polymerase sigma factor
MARWIRRHGGTPETRRVTERARAARERVITRYLTRWDGAEIAEGTAVLGRALGAGSIGGYGLQAAIAACHAQAPSAERTDWAQIAWLYERRRFLARRLRELESRAG